MALRSDLFPPVDGYLNSASVGLPPTRAVDTMRRLADDWAGGRIDPPSFDRHVERCRTAFGQIVGAPTDWVGIVPAVSIASGLVASSLPDGARVLAAEEDFTSVLYPFLADRRLDVDLVPFDRLVEQIDGRHSLVAVSAVQSADGRVADLDDLREAAHRHGTKTYVDVTQAAGWMPLDATAFDVVACGGYKWLCSPRGTGYVVTSPDNDWLVPRFAGWYSSDDPWTSIYGPPLRLADDARRYHASPPWFDVAAAADSLECLLEVGVDAIHHHDVGLVNDLRDRLGLPTSNSAIVAFETDRGDALRAAGITGAIRAGKVRLSFHLYNSTSDVDTVAEVLGTP
jgi:selenocysteine lyase/cysteine desulfurase